MDSIEAAEEEAYARLHQGISKEAIREFTADRLKSSYDLNPMIAEKPIVALIEARKLIETPHPTAAFIHAGIACEVMLRGVILKPIVYGFIQNDTIAPLIVELAFGSTGLERIKKLLTKVFQDVCGLDLMQFSRKDSKKLLWNELGELQQLRDKVLHRAEAATQAEAETAIMVASAVNEELFPALIRSLGFHLHDGIRLCRDPICSLPPEIQEAISKAQVHWGVHL
jgi:hypothetical protein